MRIALIGPVGKAESQLDRALDFSFAGMQADRVVYLGDEALVIRRRRPSIPGDAGDNLWVRSLRCKEADAETIERFVAAERRKLDWARLQVLPRDGSVEIALSEGRHVLVCHDEPSSSEALPRPTIVATAAPFDFQLRAVDAGVMLSPGSLDRAGIAIITDERELAIEVFGLRGKALGREVIETQRAAP